MLYTEDQLMAMSDEELIEVIRATPIKDIYEYAKYKKVVDRMVPINEVLVKAYAESQRIKGDNA